MNPTTLPFVKENTFTIELSKIPKYSEFEGEFIEQVDFPILELLHENEFFENKPEIRAALGALMDKVDKRTGFLKVGHHQTHNLGRYYSNESISLIPMSKYIKHTVFSYLGWKDIDMVKGHPSIAIEMSKSVGHDLQHFDHYVKNFDKIVATLSDYYSADKTQPLDKENIKWLFNSLIYGGGFESWVEGVSRGDESYLPKKFNKNGGTAHPIIINFIKDRDFMSKKIWDDNPAMRKRISKDGSSEYKNKNSVVSYWFQTIENHIVYLVARYLLAKGILQPKRYGLEMDGLNIPPCAVRFNDDEIINEINHLVASRTNLNIVFKFKSYDEKNVLCDVIEARRQMVVDVTEAEAPQEKVSGVKNDDEAAETIYRLYPHWVNCNGTLYVFNDMTGMWETSQDAHRAMIRKFKSSLMVMTFNGEEFKASKVKSYGSCVRLMDAAIEMLRTLCINDNWIKQMRNSSLKKLLFTNGYFDAKEGKFYDSFNPDILFMDRIPHAFESLNNASDIEYMTSIRKRMFYDTLGESVGEYLIQNLARGLMGDQMKRIIFGLGKSNTGKGTLSNALNLSCGGYVSSFNAGNMAYRNTSQDEAAQLRWAMLLQFKRIVISNEIKSTCELDGNMIKKIASGGDTLIARGHCSNETEFTTHYLPIVFANDLPKITPYDDAVDTRVRVISYIKNYVDEPQNEFELKGDPMINAEIETLRFQRCFVGILIESYLDGEFSEPQEVKNSKCDWIGESESNYIGKFLEDFEITNDPTDYVPSSLIESWINSRKFGISMRKFGAELKQYCTINNFQNVINKDKKLEGKAKKVWSGVRIPLIEEENVIE